MLFAFSLRGGVPLLNETETLDFFMRNYVEEPIPIEMIGFLNHDTTFKFFVK